MSYTFTVFTATYNRAHTLTRLWTSLVAQSFDEFEWLIVDDGSTDGTAALVESLRLRSRFPVRLVYQENAGKHVALDRAVDLARGEFFLPVDSDDALTENALARLREHWLAIPIERRERFSGVTAACITPEGQAVGPPLPVEPLDCSSLDAVFRWRVKGERFGFHRTDVLKTIRFPVGDDLPFVPEGVLWFAIARQYLTRFVDEPLRVYYTDGGGRLTNLALMRKGPGIAYYSHALLTGYADYATRYPLPFIKAAVHYLRFRGLVAPGVLPTRRLPVIAWPFLALGVLPALVLGVLRRPRTRTVEPPAVSRRPRVVHVITSLQTGGAEAMLAKLIAGTAAEGWESLVVCLGPDGPMGARVRAAGVATLVLGLSPRRFPLRGLWRAIVTVRQWNPAIIQGWMYHGNLAASLLRVLSNRSAKVLWNIRCTLSSVSDFPVTTRYVIRICAALSAQPTAVIFNSRTAVSQHADHGFRPRRTEVLGNGFDLNEFAPNSAARADFRAKLAVGSRDVLIGMIARFHPMKDFPNFIEAVSGVLRQQPKTRVLIAGPGVGGDNAELTTQLERAGVRDRVDRVGELVDVATVLPGLDVLCLSSAWGEAFPNIIGEAMACGVPCVATDVGDTRDIVGSAGYVVPPRDSESLMCALTKIVTLSPDAREALGAAARARVQTRYDIKVIVPEYLRLYSEFG